MIKQCRALLRPPENRNSELVCIQLETIQRCNVTSAFLIVTFGVGFLREVVAHWNRPGRTRGFSAKTRRAFLSREADYRLDLQETRRLVRRDDRFA